MAVRPNPSLSPDPTLSINPTHPKTNNLPPPPLPSHRRPPSSKFPTQIQIHAHSALRFAIRRTPRAQGLIGRSQTSAASNCSVSSGRTAFSLCICRIAVNACIRSPPFPTPSTGAKERPRDPPIAIRSQTSVRVRPNAKSQYQQIIYPVVFPSRCRIHRPFECIPHRTRRRHMRKKPRRLPE